jgi:hypothetical protein
MAEVEHMTNDAVPLAERPALIGTLEREIEELSHIEVALVEAAIARCEPVHRFASALPQAVLSVRVSERVERAPPEEAPQRRSIRWYSLGSRGIRSRTLACPTRTKRAHTEGRDCAPRLSQAR